MAIGGTAIGSAGPVLAGGGTTPSGSTANVGSANPAYNADSIATADLDNSGRTLQGAVGSGSSGSSQSGSSIAGQWIRSLARYLERDHLMEHVSSGNAVFDRQQAISGIRQRAESNASGNARFGVFSNARAQRAAFDAALRQNEGRIQNWLTQDPSRYPDLELDMVSRTPLGISYSGNVQNGQVGPLTQTPANGARLVLRRDPREPSGFRVVTLFPTVAPGATGNGNGSSTQSGASGNNPGGSTQNGGQGTGGGTSGSGQGTSGGQNSPGFQSVWGQPRPWGPSAQGSSAAAFSGTPPAAPADLTPSDRSALGGLSDAQVTKIQDGFESCSAKGWAPLDSAITALNDAAAGILSAAAIAYVATCLSAHDSLSSVRNEFR